MSELTDEQIAFINMLKIALVRTKLSQEKMAMQMGFGRNAVKRWLKNGGGKRINIKTKELIRHFATENNLDDVVPYHIKNDYLCTSCKKVMQWKKSCVCDLCDSARYRGEPKKIKVKTAAEVRQEEVKKIMAVPVRPQTTWAYWFSVEQGKRYV